MQIRLKLPPIEQFRHVLEWAYLLSIAVGRAWKWLALCRVAPSRLPSCGQSVKIKKKNEGTIRLTDIESTLSRFTYRN